VANRTAADALKDVQSLTITSGAMSALEEADALVIATEWKEFRSPDFERMRSLMREPVIFDGRNIFDPEAAAAAGFEYVGIGHATTTARDSLVRPR
jgi:UDPglucose 6-dehydrogenase